MSWVPISGPFPYLTEALAYLEENFCEGCVFRKDDPDAPMCYEVEAKILREDESVEEIDRATGTKLRCNKFKKGDPTPPQVDGQLELM